MNLINNYFCLFVLQNAEKITCKNTNFKVIKNYLLITWLMLLIIVEMEMPDKPVFTLLCISEKIVFLQFHFLKQ